MEPTLIYPDALTLVAYIESYLRDHQYAPSVREIQQDLQVADSTSTVHKWLNLMRRRGYVNWVDGQSRTIHVMRNPC